MRFPHYETGQDKNMLYETIDASLDLVRKAVVCIHKERHNRYPQNWHGSPIKELLLLLENLT